MRMVSLSEYVKEVLKCAEYRRGDDLNCVVAVAPVLPGCMTQGKNFEEARDNLIDAIELWITVGLREGEEIPVVNGCRLASAYQTPEETGERARSRG
jgi:predicted RNase H-like HicB family nuclease